MTATIELDDHVVKHAEQLSGITDVQELVSMSVNRFISGAELVRAATRAKEVIGDENPFWEDYDPRA
jgi:hypothetical protein